MTTQRVKNFVRINRTGIQAHLYLQSLDESLFFFVCLSVCIYVYMSLCMHLFMCMGDMCVQVCTYVCVRSCVCMKFNFRYHSTDAALRQSFSQVWNLPIGVGSLTTQ